MFTEESHELQNYFFPKLKVKNRKEYQLLYQFFQSSKLLPIKKKQDYENHVKKSMSSQKSLELPHFFNKNEDYTFSRSIFKIKGLDITINVYSHIKYSYQSFINKIIQIIQFVASLTNIRKTKLTLNYYLNKNKKIIHKNIQQLTKKEINSGYCIQKENETIITIYRIEEIMKVTIHELIHAFNYDSFQDNQDIINHYQNKYNISSKEINTHEAYTEIWATLINCYLISKRVQRNHQYNLFLILLEFEKLFSAFQCYKIFYLMKLSQKNIDINKYTNILSYFIIKEEIFRRLPSFLTFCKRNNMNYIRLKKKNEWFMFLKKNDILSKNNLIFNHMNKENYLFRTMRMSMNELNIMHE